MCKLFDHPVGVNFRIQGEDLTRGRGNSGEFETPVGAMLQDI